MTGHRAAPEHTATLARITRGLRMVTVPFPHLTGLAAAVRVAIDERVPTMGIFASGRLVANPAFTARLSPDDLIFVLAHELLHLALKTHDRAVGSSRLEFNFAHDYIINDMLRHALKLSAIPANGLDMAGARHRSAEEIVLDMRRNAGTTNARTQVWEGELVSVEKALGSARQANGENAGDVLDDTREKAMFPGDADDQKAKARAIRDLAARGLALAKALDAMRGRGTDPGLQQQQVRALRGIYRAPWQIALQRWLDGVSPSHRTYTRASRRGADREDIVLAGRHRHSIVLTVILDTSASMGNDIAAALGAIADFSEAAGVDEIRLIQCDTVVTSDEWLSAAELADYEVKGYGGSDLTPALLALAEDARVSAALVITDGDISYPQDAMPYAVLWAVPGDTTTFDPPYGRVITMSRGAAS